MEDLTLVDFKSVALLLVDICQNFIGEGGREREVEREIPKDHGTSHEVYFQFSTILYSRRRLTLANQLLTEGCSLAPLVVSPNARKFARR